jgi:hypothetical protein
VFDVVMRPQVSAVDAWKLFYCCHNSLFLGVVHVSVDALLGNFFGKVFVEIAIGNGVAPLQA